MRVIGVFYLFFISVFLVACTTKQKTKEQKEVFSLYDSIGQDVNQYMFENYADSNLGMVSVGLYFDYEGSSSTIDTTLFYSNSSLNPLPNDSTRYQIGSITKTFTAAVTAQMINDGLIVIDDYAQKYLPDTLVLPIFKNGELEIQMTVEDLLTYSSGWKHQYSTPDSTTYAGLFNWFKEKNRLPKRPGTWTYVNTDFSTLGLIYSYLRYPKEVDFYNKIPVVLDSLCTALGMENSSVNPDTINPIMNNIALPYNNQQPSSYFFSNWPANYGAGGIYSSIGDMMTYLKANLGENAAFDKQLLDSLQYLRQEANNSSDSIGLGWFYAIGNHEVNGTKYSNYWKDGGTQAFQSFIIFAEIETPDGKKAKAGAVVMANNGDTSVSTICGEIYGAMLESALGSS